MIRVLIADDHARFRSLLAEHLASDGFDVCAQAPSATVAVELAVAHTPDVCLLDVHMPGDGVAAARHIAEKLPNTRVLMVTVSADSDDVLDALEAGAHGYVLKDSAFDDISRAVREVADGAIVVAPGVTPALVEEIRRVRTRRLRTDDGLSVQLTEREWCILELLHEERPTNDIAAQLYVAPVTVRSHIAALVRKVGVRDRDAAVALYRRQRAVSL